MTTAQQQLFKRCPACGDVSAASVRCNRCLRSIIDVPPLPAEDVAGALEQARRPQVRRSLPARRVLVTGAVVIVALVAVWWGYSWLWATPAAPRAPASAERSVSAGAWSTADGDGGGTRSTSAESHIEGVEIWRAQLGTPIVAPLVTDGRVAAAALRDGRVVGIDASSGEGVWTITLANPPVAAPVLAGDHMYIAGRDGGLTAFNTADGAQIWRVPLARNPLAGPPAVADGVVYVTTEQALFALDAENGRTLWHYPMDVSWAPVAPVVEGNVLAVAAGDRVALFDRTTGEQTYFYTLTTRVPSSLAIRDGTVTALYGSLGVSFDTTTRRPWWDDLASLSLGGGTVRGAWYRLYIYRMAPPVPPQPARWETHTLPRRTFAAAAGPDIVVVASPSGAVTALHQADGTVAWEASARDPVVGPILAADGVVLIGDQRLTLLDRTLGDVRSERATPPLIGAAVDARQLLLATADGDVIAIR
jgi:outer membrane protein assembly factor BamB